jgi:hypothetical protein
MVGSTDISEVYVASIIRPEEKATQENGMKRAERFRKPVALLAACFVLDNPYLCRRSRHVLSKFQLTFRGKYYVISQKTELFKEFGI